MLVMHFHEVTTLQRDAVANVIDEVRMYVKDFGRDRCTTIVVVTLRTVKRLSLTNEAPRSIPVRNYSNY